MKRRWLALAVALLLLCAPALADSVSGSWSGSARAAGRRFSASCTFNGSGGFSASAAGISVSGSYSLSGNSVTLSARGVSITFSISQSGNRQTMSGSGRYKGVKGTITLSRTITGKAGMIWTPTYGAWTSETDTVRLYAGGYLYWAHSDPQAAGEQAFIAIRDGLESGEIVDFAGIEAAIAAANAPAVGIARVTLDGNVLTVEPLADDAALFGDGTLPCAVEDGTLCLGDLRLTRTGNVDRLPAEPAFRPYLTLKRGDEGQAVQDLQTALIAQGYLEAGGADGDFGRKTETAVSAFQTAQGLEATGVADPETIMAIYVTSV